MEKPPWSILPAPDAYWLARYRDTGKGAAMILVAALLNVGKRLGLTPDKGQADLLRGAAKRMAVIKPGNLVSRSSRRNEIRRCVPSTLVEVIPASRSRA